MGTQNLAITSKLTGTDGAFGGYVNFTVTKNLNAVGPLWTLTHFKGPGNFASVSEANTDKLIYAFGVGPHAGSKFDIKTSAVGLSEKSDKAEDLLSDILINQITTQLGTISGGLQ